MTDIAVSGKNQLRLCVLLPRNAMAIVGHSSVISKSLVKANLIKPDTLLRSKLLDSSICGAYATSHMPQDGSPEAT